MGTATLILGESGTGKSASLRDLNPDDCLLIQTIRKPLPFKTKGWKKWNKADPKTSVFATDNWEAIIQAIKSAPTYGKSVVVIDDFQYVMGNEFMRRSDEKSFDKFTEIGSHAWQIIDAAIKSTPDELRVYFLSHTEETQSGRVKIKTIGKMLDEKITIEGMFTIVLRTLIRDGQYFFTTKNNGFDTVKSPMGMFETHEIENNLSFVDSVICDYYEIQSPIVQKDAAA